MKNNVDNSYCSRQFLNLPQKSSPAFMRTMIDDNHYSMEIRDCSNVVTLHGSMYDDDERQSLENFRYKMNVIIQECTKALEHVEARIEARKKENRRRPPKPGTKIKVYHQSGVRPMTMQSYVHELESPLRRDGE